MNDRKPYIVGLTGGIASGKTTATDYLASLGACVLDADVESRALTAPGGEALPAIRAAFGDGVFRADGTLDRRALGDVVFSDAASRRRLEAIIHPLVKARMLRGAEGRDLVFFSVPLLFESGMDALCDETWALTVSRETQLARLMARDRLTGEEAERRVRSQLTGEERAARADVVISSEGTIQETREALAARYRELLGRVRAS